MIREPVVEGIFYPAEKDVLIENIKLYVTGKFIPKEIKGLISPHAGYVYSGSCAGKGYASAIIPNRVVILGVDHNGRGNKMSVDPNEMWQTALGKIEVDRDFAEELIKENSLFDSNNIGDSEHSIEVQVPFIQYLNSKAKIVPIIVSTYDKNKLSDGAQILSSVIEKKSGSTLVVASSDMSHYISAEEAKEKDFKAIEKILKLDPDGMMDVVSSERISMCGVAPVYLMIKTVLALGAKKCEVVEYTNSGVTSGDFNQVVGYLSASIY